MIDHFVLSNGDIEKYDYNGLVNKPIRGYVTPEDYGAKGDGVTDDSVAIQSAIDSNKRIVFPSNKYHLGSTAINFNDKSFYAFDASHVEFSYNGTGHAFKFLHDTYCDFKFGRIYAPNGGCLSFYGTDRHTTSDGTTARDWSCYDNIYFGSLYAGDGKNCITVDSQGTNWINEMRIHNGRFEHGENGLYLVNNSPYGISHWVFYNIGVEGVSKGFNLNVGENGVGNSGFVWFGLRTGEASNVITAVGNNHEFSFYDGDYFSSNKMSIDSDCDDWTIFSGSDIQTIKNGILTWSSFKRLYNLQQGVSIAENKDLNTVEFAIPAVYTVSNKSTAESLTNCPASTAFRMVVQSTNGDYVTDTKSWAYVTRIIFPLGSTDLYIQTASSNGSRVWTFGEWKKIVSTDIS